MCNFQCGTSAKKDRCVTKKAKKKKKRVYLYTVTGKKFLRNSGKSASLDQQWENDDAEINKRKTRMKTKEYSMV